MTGTISLGLKPASGRTCLRGGCAAPSQGSVMHRLVAFPELAAKAKHPSNLRCGPHGEVDGFFNAFRLAEANAAADAEPRER